MDPKPRKRPANGFKWEQEVVTYREAAGVEPNFKPWTTRRGVFLSGVHPLPRELEMIDVTWIRACHAAGRGYDDPSVARGLVCDPTQSLERCHHAVHTLGTKLKNSRFYAYEFDRVLLAADFLRVMGYDYKMLDGFDESVASGMVGEAIALPEIATIVKSILCCLNSPGLFERPPEFGASSPPAQLPTHSHRPRRSFVHR